MRYLVVGRSHVLITSTNAGEAMNLFGQSISLYRVNGVNAELGLQPMQNGGLYVHFPSMGTSPARKGQPGKRRNPERYDLKLWLRKVVLEFSPNTVTLKGGPGGSAIIRTFRFRPEWDEDSFPIQYTKEQKKAFATWLDSAVAAVGNYRYDVFLEGFKYDWRGPEGDLETELPWSVTPTGKVSRSKAARK